MVSSKILYALGYNILENYIVYFPRTQSKGRKSPAFKESASCWRIPSALKQNPNKRCEWRHCQVNYRSARISGCKLDQTIVVTDFLPRSSVMPYGTVKLTYYRM